MSDRPRRPLRRIAGLVLVLAVGLLVARTLVLGGLFTTLRPRGGDGCRRVEGFTGGTEDLAPAPGGDGFFVSSAPLGELLAGDWHRTADLPRGALYRVRLADPAPIVEDVTPPLDQGFVPHGIDVGRDASGRPLLYAVNHAPRLDPGRGAWVEHLIEVFEVPPAGPLVHRRTLRDPLLVSPNDVAAAGPERLYVTNDHRFPSGLGRLIEDFLILPLGTIATFDGRDWRVAFQGTTYANGIIADPRGERLFVAETTAQRVSVFAIGPRGDLRRERTIDVGTGADNLTWGAPGELLVGAHPKLLDFLRHAADHRHPSPSQVLVIEVDRDPPRLTTRLEDPGQLISASSVALAVGDHLVVGDVFAPHLLVCPRPAP